MFSFDASRPVGSSVPSPAVAGRSCGSCSLCCKVLEVKPMFSAAGQWCKLCDPGRGCKQHMLRPKECRDFNCLWLTDAMFDPEWKPEVAKFVMSLEYNETCLAIHVDPKLPNAWRKDPYAKTIRTLVEKGLAHNCVTMVVEPRGRTLLLPDREIALGAHDARFTWEIKPGRTADGATSYEVVFDRAA